MSPLPKHFDEWIATFFDETLDRETHQNLEAALLASENARRVFCQSAATQSDMLRVLGVADPEIPRLKPFSLLKPFTKPLAKPFAKPFAKPLAWAAAAVVLLSLTLPLLLTQPKPFEAVGSDTAVTIPDVPGQYRVTQKTELELQDGLYLQFAAGTLFTLQDRPPNGRQPLELQKGILNIRVNSPHPGVVLSTPAGTLQDIGTTFEVEVEDGSNRVFAEVTDGKVTYTPKDSNQKSQTLTPGQGRIELSLSTDLGHVIDREGNGTLRPFMGSRWSVARIGMPIEAQDWLKTGRRGANALKIRLRNGTEMILGPDTLIEVRSQTEFTVHRGEFQIKAPEKIQLNVQGPEGISWSLENETAIGRTTDKDMQKLAEAPGWLKGYLSDDSTEAMGSLLAKVDGRNVPLTMGYHKVTVDIRDQIARTVIEESFINHTHQVLEGIFYFPLPADASISEFGMWIGDELVHGEIVEKQRAREIYETILREKRDPGLLEWSGGNLFKARVYPIVGEKRIKIGYTQVLPKVGNRYSYRYGLQSDLFRQMPLKELKLEVRVHSAESLRQVFSPSHLCRTDRSEHAAVVEYQAEEVVPERDFVLHIETRADDTALRVIPHSRGDDGYFMMMLQPPDTGVPPSRSLLTAADPMQLVVMVDTSGSVSGPVRKTQLDFLSALLNGLGDEDRVQVMTFDTEVRWVTDAFTEMSPENRGQILEAVEERNPLGWSDFDLAFDALQKRIQGPARVIVISDGIPTTRDADARAWIDRFSRMSFDDFTFHAVAPGNQYEASVLKAMAGKGGGSWRGIDSEDPSGTANSLLNELTTPSVKNLSLQFKGLDVAAVYPEILPNLPVGSQQRIVGRYNASAGQQKGEVVVTGTFDGKPVAYTTTIELDSAEEGNSFIPRLWARSHLDKLLAQGPAPEIQEQIISLSEAYQIMTPYTSFLVLESDADRERFAVEKKFRMRDGERFFAEGRDSATYALRRQQMLRAKTWRKQLYLQIRQELKLMGREPLQSPNRYSYGYTVGGVVTGGGDPFGGGGGGATGGLRYFSQSEVNGRHKKEGNDFSRLAKVRSDRSRSREDLPLNSSFEILSDREPALPSASPMDFDQRAGESLDYLSANVGNFKLRSQSSGRSQRQNFDAYGSGSRMERRSSISGMSRGFYQPAPVQAGFPTLTQRGEPALPQTWSPEIRDLLSSLNRRTFFRESSAGFTLKHRVSSLNEHEEWIPQGEAELLILGTSWWTNSLHNPGVGYQVEWNTDTGMGIVDTTWRLGKTRTTEKNTTHAFTAPFSGYFGNQLQAMMFYMEAVLEAEGERFLIRFTHQRNPQHQEVWVIDPSRFLLLERRFLQNDTLIGRHVFTDFKQIAGSWWPGLIEFFNAENTCTREERIEITAEAGDTMLLTIDQLRAELLKDAVVLSAERPSPFEAMEALNAGTATLDHVWVLLMETLNRQRADLAEKYWKEVEVRIPGTTGLARIRLMYLQNTRRLEAYQDQLMAMVTALRTSPGEVDYSRAIELMQFSQQASLAPQERKDVLDALEPVLRRQASFLNPMQPWYQHMLNVYDALGQPENALEVSRLLAEQTPNQSYSHTQHAQRLMQLGEVDAAIDFLKQSLQTHPNWTESDVQNIYSTLAQFLWQVRRLDALIDTIESCEPPEISIQTWSIYLTALFAHHEGDKAHTWMETRVDDVIQGSRSPEAKAAYLAVINRLTGNGYQHYSNQVTESHSRRLKEIVLQLLPQEDAMDLIQPIATHHAFKRSAHAEALWKEMYAILHAQVDVGNPDKINSLIQWLRWAGFQPDQAGEWNEFMDRVILRWEQSEQKNSFNLISDIFTNGTIDQQLKINRILLQRSDSPEAKKSNANQIFTLLLQKSWSDEVMQELPLRLSQLDLSVPETVRTHTRQWVDWVDNSRQTYLIERIENRHQLSRRELDEATQKVENENQHWMVQWLRAQEMNPPQPEMKRWLQLDRAFYQVLAESDLPTLKAEGTALLRDAIHAPPDLLTETDKIFIHRWVSLLSNLTVKTINDAADSLPLMELLEQGESNQAFDLDWKAYIYQLLIALDRGDDLEARLEQWVGSDDLELRIQWGVAYAMILAERNQIESAVEIFETLKKENVLSFQDYRTLSDWYTVLNKRENAEQSKIDAWSELPEHVIQNWLYQQSNRYSQSQSNDMPEELDPEIPNALRALFRKSVSPGNYLWQVNRIYSSTRDFRLLAALVDSVIGQSQQGVYSYLGSMHQVLNLLQEEATLDEMLDRIETLRAQDLTPTDHRALHLLSFVISNQAVKQAQGTSTHIDRAHEALQQAFKGEWAEGEAVQMSTLLAGLGALPSGKLLEEQLRQLSILRNRVPPGSRDHLIISKNYASVLWSANQKDEAVQLLESSLNLHRNANGGMILIDQVSTLNELSSYYSSLKRFRQAEGLWISERMLDYPHRTLQEMKQNLYQVYQTALAQNGSVSLGSGENLYQNLQKVYLDEISGELDITKWNDWVQGLCALWREGQRKEYKSVPDDARRFAFSVLPGLLQRAGYDNGQSVIGNVQKTLYDINGSETALEFLVQRAETEPDSMKELQNNFWNAHGNRIAWLRHQSAKDLSKSLQARVLAIVLDAERDELENQRSRNKNMYWRNHSYYWAEKEPAYIATAIEVMDAFPDSESHQLYIANYLFHGVDQPKLATDRLMQAYQRGILAWEGRFTLTGYLESENRETEALDILPPLIEERPDHLDAQARLIRCLHRNGDSREALDQLAKTDTYFRSENRWTEQHAFTLAEVSFSIDQFLKSAAYYDEAIVLHVKTQPNRGIGNGVLSRYYEKQSRAYQNAGDTEKAVNAIAGAIVSRGPDQDERRRDLNRLDDIIRNADNLDAYITRFEQEVETTGLDNPILRKALGKYFLEMRDYAKANPHLRQALALQPDDAETRQLLLDSYSKNQQPEEAIDLLLETITRNPHELEHYQALAKRYQQTERPLETERANTSMVEALPRESESHEALALIREKQNNREAALVHWNNVIRIRTKEPTGYLGKLRTFIHLNRMPEARKVFDHLIQTQWPDHFGNVKQQAQSIMGQQKQ
ncbi:MAG: VIT domain-containing protein [Kiritimatiellia bacterium]